LNTDDGNSSDPHQAAPTMNTELQGESLNSIENHDSKTKVASMPFHAPEAFPKSSMSESASLWAPLGNTVEEISIYSIRTSRQRNIILGVIAMIAFLLPFSDSIYLPALSIIKVSLNTSDILVTLSVSIYLFMSGIASLVWGQVSDRFGRRITLLVALITFMIVTIGCVYSPNVTVLLVLRTIQGGVVSATAVVGQSLIADIYTEETRGSAAGLFFLPFNVAPIIGPLIGGPLSSVFGWRSTFVFLAIYTFFAIIALLILLPETHQYFVKEQYHKANPTKRIIDAIPNELLPFQNPYKPLLYLVDPTTMPYIVIASIMFGTLFTSFTLFSFYLRQAPYNYSTAMIGVLYAPSGLSMLIGSIFGGWLSDKASEYFGHGKCPEGRLVPAMILSILTPIGVIIYGWTFQYKLNVIVPIFGQILLSFGQAVVEPSVSSYLVTREQTHAAAVSAANTFLNLCTGGILITLAIPMQSAMGTGLYFSFLGCINVFTIVFVSILMYKAMRRGNYTAM
jgi:multidrug resistance protein